jgi:hypothetical protein
MRLSKRVRAALFGVGLATCGCSYMKTPFLLDTLNSGVGSGTPPPRPSPQERVARVTATHLTDSYFNPAQVAGWLQQAGAKSEPIVTQLKCLRSSRPALESCYNAIDLAAPAAWNLPALPPLTEATLTTDVALTEVDVERFVANARWIASSALVLEDSLGRLLTDAELQAGIKLGAERAGAYIKARSWHRNVSRPTTALVMSGGGATGAFTAGFASRIMDVFKACHHAAGGDACPDARIDLMVGTSTGTLVGVMLDLFQVPGQEELAQKTLIENYTCSTEKDLYCKYDKWDWALADNVRGLMRFNGIEKKLAATMTPAMQTNSSELVTVAVDYDSGDLYAQSDQDPRDRGDADARVQSVLA